MNKSLDIKHKRNLLLIFLLLALLMISNAVFELFQNRKDLRILIENQSHTLLTSLIVASENSFLAIDYLDELSKEKFSSNFTIIKSIYDYGHINLLDLDDICIKNNLESIVIFNNDKKIVSSGSLIPGKLIFHNNIVSRLEPIFSNISDTLIFSFERAESKDKVVFGMAIATNRNDAIYIAINTEKNSKIIRETGFGPLIRKVAEDNHEIIYIAYQDSFNILAATGNITELEPIQDSEFLSKSIRDTIFNTRRIQFDSLDIFESVHPFTLNENTYGLLRLGLSTHAMKEINKRVYNRLIIISLVLLLIGFIILKYIFTQQQYSILKNSYQVVETYSRKIINNVSDAIIVLDIDTNIKILNGAAEKLFKINNFGKLPLRLSNLFPENECINLINKDNSVFQINCSINKEMKILLISKSIFYDTDSHESVILVLKDITSELLMQGKIDRQERMTAMGELAAGVAHEIRNPLNTIGTIIQQLNKDFTPISDKEEYYEFTNIVYSEVNRINKTVKDFLRFARPEPIQVSEFSLSKLLYSLKKQYQQLFSEKNITFNLDIEWDGIVNWDKNQIKQVIINLIQNAFEALTLKGNFDIKVYKLDTSEEISILITDNGSGMNEDVKLNIFNLYYTTKAAGTGIGLSIVQRIIYEHGGFISVDSEIDKGTTFTLRMPINAQID